MAARSDAPKRIVILGAGSAIAEEAARAWARRGPVRFALVGRQPDRLEAVAANLRVLGAEAASYAADLDTADAAALISRMAAEMGRLDIVLLAYGTLGDQQACERDPKAASQLLHTNFISAAAWCLAAASALEAQGHGSLVVIGSVAGDRGRASNFIYGAAKGGLGILLQGLAHRLTKAGARAVLIKPGFVDTPMTAHISGRGGPLWSTPARVAAVIVKVAEPASKGRAIVYAPRFWRWIMFVIRNIPERIFHKTRL
ncbi:MAG: SDR family NAD(P)-dependent oxidoreductase [Hyphomicrobiales bacterium]|nr:MAG: SDR family NAD(P)-dependent oxidoreductase [Hyphomicrobiales bacterium]